MKNETLLDKDIRELLFFFLEENYGKVRFFEEKIMGRSRADVVMVTNNALVGIEIKSDRDTYQRLKRQVRDYNKFFDMNYIVVGTTHAQHVFEHVPDHWGIITVEVVEGAADFYELRKPQKNPKLQMKNKMTFLWKSELDNIKKDYIKFKYKEKSKAFVAEKIIEAIPEDRLNELVSEELFERDYTYFG